MEEVKGEAYVADEARRRGGQGPADQGHQLEEEQRRGGAPADGAVEADDEAFARGQAGLACVPVGGLGVQPPAEGGACEEPAGGAR